MQRPSYMQGFSPRDGAPRYPSLWRGCVFAAAPCLGPSGVTLYDWSGFGNHGTLTNMDPATDYVISAERYCLDFDNTNDQVRMPVKVIAGADHSQTCWVMTRATNDDQYVLALETFVGEILCRIDIGASGKIFGYVFDGASRNIGAAAISANMWYHACFTRSGNVFTFYLNGRQTGQATYTPTIFAGNGVNDIGGRRNNATLNPMNGQIDDVRIYNRAIAPSEVAVLAARRGIAYELAEPVAYTAEQAAAFQAAWAYRQRMLIGGGVL